MVQGMLGFKLYQGKFLIKFILQIFVRTLVGSETIDENKHAIKQVMLHRNDYFRFIPLTPGDMIFVTHITFGSEIVRRKFQADYSNDIALILLKTKITFDNYAGNEYHFRFSLPVSLCSIAL